MSHGPYVGLVLLRICTSSMSDGFKESRHIAPVIPLRLLFWNMGSSATPTLVGMLAAEYEPDVIVLAESAHGIAELVEEINMCTRLLYTIPFHATGRIRFLVRIPRERIQLLSDREYMAIKHIYPVLGQSFTLVAVHLPGKTRLPSEDQESLCCRWGSYIREAETRVGHSRTILIGDLNMNPFERGAVSAEGLHAISSRAVAARKTRTVLNEERPLFYNPMWSMMGDAIGPPGTYYYASSKPISYFWNTFDQILLRPDLARYFVPGDVAILSSIDGKTLLNPRGLPDRRISDHLPILATIRLELDQ